MCETAGRLFFDGMNSFKADSIEKRAHIVSKLIFILLNFIADKVRGISLAFRLLNVD